MVLSEPLRGFSVPASPVFAYCCSLFVSVTEALKGVDGRIADVKMSVLAFGDFLCVVSDNSLKWLSVSWLAEQCDSASVLKFVLKQSFKKWFDYGIPR